MTRPCCHVSCHVVICLRFDYELSSSLFGNSWIPFGIPSHPIRDHPIPAVPVSLCKIPQHEQLCPLAVTLWLQSMLLSLLASGQTFGAGLQFHLNGGEPVAMSVPATEHSVMTAWRTEREAMENMIDHFGIGLLACVMDSYDYVQVSQSQLPLLCSSPSLLLP